MQQCRGDLQRGMDATTKTGRRGVKTFTPLFTDLKERKEIQRKRERHRHRGRERERGGGGSKWQVTMTVWSMNVKPVLRTVLHVCSFVSQSINAEHSTLRLLHSDTNCNQHYQVNGRCNKTRLPCNANCRDNLIAAAKIFDFK